MRRADRLFQIIQILRLRSVTTAAYLADELEVSERTIYRDINDLLCSGVPINGEAGVGYALQKGFDLPPLMFSEDEIEALVLGARTVGAWADPELRKAANSALRKIEAVVPQRLQTRVRDAALFSHNFRASATTAANLQLLRPAIRTHQKICFSYERVDGAQSRRTNRPLALTFFGPNWLLSGWCELRDAFRNFRVDRMSNIDVLEEQFEEEPGKTLEDFFALVNKIT